MKQKAKKSKGYTQDPVAKEFLDLLRREKLLLPLLFNLKRVRGKNYTMREHLKSCSPSQWIGGSFIWHLTSEGSTVWNDLNDKWKYIYRS